MPNDKQEPFGEYAPEPQTAGMPPISETPPTEEVEGSKYGIGKPTRIIVRGTLAADKDPDHHSG